MNNAVFKLALKNIEKIACYDPEKDCEQLFCILHESDYLGGHSKDGHVCLACNLNDSLEMVYIFLRDLKEEYDVNYKFTTFILLLYLVVEKLTIIFKAIGISQEYVEENWFVLVEIRKWANFIKHPKGFLFTHHPEYFFDSELALTAEQKQNSPNQYIEYDYVKRFYSRENPQKAKQLLAEVANKDKIVVVFSCPDRLTEEFVKVCREFCEKIKENPHFKEILKKHSFTEEITYL